jgi:cation diffusion facilitator family transporter
VNIPPWRVPPWRTLHIVRGKDAALLGDRRLGVDELYRGGRKAALWGVAIGLLLGIAKLLGGYYGDSFALLSDSVHSLGDALVSGVVYVALRWAQTPADLEHPYGHARIESVAASNVALFLILSGVAIIWESIRTIADVSPAPATFAMWIAGISVVIKEGLYRYHGRVAGRTGSTALKATAWDYRMDAFSSLAVLVALATTKVGGTGFHSADHIAAILVAISIFWAGGHLYWKSIQDLMDRQAPDAVVQAVRRQALSVIGVAGVEKLFVRKTGLEFQVDIHVEVDPNMTVRASHAIAHAVKDQIVGQIVTVKDVLVHIEPAAPH